MGACTGVQKRMQTRIDRTGGQLDTHNMVDSPRSLIPYALGFLLMGAGLVVWFKWTEPNPADQNGVAPAETLPDVYNVL